SRFDRRDLRPAGRSSDPDHRRPRPPERRGTAAQGGTRQGAPAARGNRLRRALAGGLTRAAGGNAAAEYRPRERTAVRDHSNPLKGAALTPYPLDVLRTAAWRLSS